MGEGRPLPDRAIAFGTLLRQHRRDAGLTQEGLAERAGMGARSIRALERGERRAPYHSTVELLESALDLHGEERAAFREAAMFSRHGLTSEAHSKHPEAPGQIIPRYSLSTEVPLVGRDSELRQILNEFDLARGGCRLTLLESQAGGGKTRLLAEAARQIRAKGAITLAGGCYEQEGRVPFGPIHDALLDYIQAQPSTVLRARLSGIEFDIARLLPELRDRMTFPMGLVEGESERPRLFASIAVFIERIAAVQPVLMVLDDLHWADDTTLSLTHYLVRQLKDSHVLLLGAYRDDEMVEASPLAQFAQDADRESRGGRLQLGPLTADDLASLAAERLGGPCTESLLRALHERSGGNPFFLLQMLRLLQQEAALVQSAGGWQMLPGAALKLPSEVRDAIAQRVHKLPAGVRETLTAGAMLGREFSYWSLAAITTMEELTLDRTLDAAVAAHVLAETPDGYVFRHPLLREVIYNEISRQRRARWHARAGLALESLYGSAAPQHASELALHFEGAGERFHAQAVHYLTLAGNAASQALVWQEAREYYTRATDLATSESPATEAEEKLGTVLKTLACYADSLDVLRRAARDYERLGDYDAVVRTLAHEGATYLSSGQVVEGSAHLEHELARMEQLASPQALAMAYGALAGLYHVQSRLVEQRAAAERGAELARQSGDAQTIADAAAVLGLVLTNEGKLEEASVLLAEALAAAEPSGSVATRILVLNNLAWIADVRGETEKSASYLEAAATSAQQYGNLPQLIFILHAQGRHAFWRGDWDTAHHVFEQAAALDAQIGQSWASPYLHLWLGRMSLARGDWDTGIERLRTCLGNAERSADWQVTFQARCVLAEHDLSLGHATRARDDLISLLNTTDSGIEDLGLARSLPLLARAYLGSGDTEMAEATARRAVAIAQKQGYREALMTALQAQGEVLAARGRGAAAEILLTEALQLARAMYFPLHEANIMRSHGELAVRTGNVQEGRREMSEALEIYRRLGARQEIHRTEAAIERLSD